MVLPRSSGYVGTLIDDITVKGTDEPYRVMTSRSEYRLLLRQDNAKKRLIEYGRAAGLVTDDAYEAFLEEERMVEDEKERLSSERFHHSDKLEQLLEDRGYPKLAGGIQKAELLRRPGISLADLYELEGAGAPKLPPSVLRRVENEIKYEGYIRRQLEDVEKSAKLEEKRIPEDLDYNAILGMRLEARQKLSERRPATVGIASRVPGVSPADISVLLVALAQYGNERKGDI